MPEQIARERAAAGMFLLVSFLAASWMFRKSFCGWLCPFGALQELLAKLARVVSLPQWSPQRGGELACQPTKKAGGRR